MAMLQWSFDGFAFPVADSPSKGNADDWSYEERLIEHNPLMSNTTVLTSLGFVSRRRSIRGTCSAATRDTLQTKQLARIVGVLIDSENRSVTCRIVRARFITLLPKNSGVDCEANAAGGRYSYAIEFLER